MIHVVSVLAGNSSHAQIAQRHAIRIAQLFRARLRVALIWEPEMTEAADMGGRTWEVIADEEVKRISQEAGDPSVLVESSLRGEGLHKGLLAEARETDLLVVGLPRCATDDEPLCKAIRHNELPLLPRAECLVLVVYEDPAPIRSVLVDYQGGTAGKTALRAAGEIAIHTSAAVTVLSVERAADLAELLTASAKRYLDGFGIPTITTIERLGEPGSEEEVLEVAESTGADLVVIGGEQYGMLKWLRARTAPHPEEISEALHKPVLIAR
jgi:nucleotide-binding universal stress UspA family protein